MAHTHTPTG